MDPNEYYFQQQNIPTPQPAPRNTMSTVSLILGICSIACCFLSFPIGALGIIFAILSRGSGKMNGMAKTGLGLSIGGMGLFILAFIVYISFAISSGLFSSAWAMSQKYDLNDPNEVQEFMYEYEDSIRNQLN